MARYPAIDCDPFQYFYNQVAIFDTTLWYVPLLIDGGEQYPMNFASAAVTGPLAYGHHLGYPAKSRVALLELVSPRAKSTFATTDRISKKLVSIYWYPREFHPRLTYIRLFQIGKLYRTSDTRRTRHDIHTRASPLVLLTPSLLPSTECSCPVTLLSLKPTTSRSSNRCIH